MIIAAADGDMVEMVLAEYGQPMIWPHHDKSAWCDEGVLEWMLCDQIRLFVPDLRENGWEVVITTPDNDVASEVLTSMAIGFDMISIDTPKDPIPLDKVSCPDGSSAHTFNNGVTCCCSGSWSQTASGSWMCGDGINFNVTVIKN